MKKHLLMLTMIALFASCSNDSDDPIVPALNSVTISPTFSSSGTMTKATELSFEEGDKIGLTIIKEDQSTYADNSLMTYTNSVFEGNVAWYEGKETSKMLAYYPYSSAGAPTSFSILADQTTGYGASDLMGAVKDNVQPTNDAVGMIFKHLLSKIVVNVQTDTDIASVVLQNSIPTATVDLENLTTTVDQTDTAADITAQTITSNANYRAIVVPQTSSLTIVVTTAQGKVHTQKLSSATLVGGGQYSISVEITNDQIKVAMTGDIENWTNEGEIDPNSQGTPEIPVKGYNVQVKESGSNEWKSIEVGTATVDKHKEPNQPTSYFAQFDMASEVDVMVTYEKPIGKVNIRPTQKGVEFTRKDEHKNTIYFSLSKPAYLSIEFDDERFGNLQLFADNVFNEELPSPDSEWYFGPGEYPSPNPDGIVWVPGNTIVYIDKDAILNYGFKVKDTENVRIIGRGQFRDTPNHSLIIENSKNVTVDGIMFVDPNGASILMESNSSDITIKNVKSFSDQLWGDGINIRSSSKVEIDNVYLRNSDDCVAIYASRLPYSKGGSNNISVKNAVLWADNAHPINIGTHGDIAAYDVIEEMTFTNIDILEHHERSPAYQGCLAITCGDNNIIRNLLFENIRIENIEEGKLFSLAITYNPDEDNLDAGKSIEDIIIRNVSYTPEYPAQNKVTMSVVKGYNSTRLVKNITIENVIDNGRKINLSDLDTNPYVADIIVK